MKKTLFKIFMGLFVLFFASVWIAGSVAEARSKGMNKREHHRHHSPSNVEVGDVVAVASGGFHTIELKTDGTVWAWGKNELGQLGDGTTIDSPAPIQVSGLTDITAIAGGGSHTIALRADGTVWAWGDNKYGQLGVTTPETCVNYPDYYSPYYFYSCSTIPIQISGLTDVIAIAAGNKHTIALKSDGTVWAWGYNGYGQLGTETTEICQTWSTVMGLHPLNNSCSTTPIQISGLADVDAIATGNNHTIVLKTDGTVWAWGWNNFGQLGVETIETCYTFSCSSTPVQVSSLTDITAIAVGAFHSLALKIDGTVWSWGSNEHGQLGDGTIATRTTPVQVSGLTGVTAIAAGGTKNDWPDMYEGHTLAVKTDGTVWAWGDNEHGQLGVTTTELCEIYIGLGKAGSGSFNISCSTTPIQVSGLTDVSAIAAGGYHTLALKSYGTVWAWGDNEYGQLGVITTETCGYHGDYDCSPTPVPVRSKATGTFSVGGIVSSLTGTLVLQNNGGDDLTITDDSLFTFATELEDLAIYDITVLSQPFDQTCSVVTGRVNATDVVDIEIKCFTFVAIAAGYSFSLALEMDGTVWAWGANYSGQLGNGTTIDSTTPVQVSGLTDVIAIAAGGNQTLALKTNGTVWAWGSNGSGELGVTTAETCGGYYPTPCSTTPLQVSGLTGVTTIAAGGNHNVVLEADGTVWVWGSNWAGQLGVTTTEICGDYSTPCSTTPLQVSGLTDVTAIVAGWSNSMTIKVDGTVWAWGGNGSGQLGDGTTIDSTMPVQVSDLTDVTTIAAGSHHTLALKDDGTVWAWGSNWFRQLGNITIFPFISTPVQIITP